VQLEETFNTFCAKNSQLRNKKHTFYHFPVKKYHDYFFCQKDSSVLGGHGKNGMYQTIRTLFKIWILSRLDGVSSNHNAVLPYIKMAIQRPNSYTPFNGTLEIKNESYDEPK